MNIIYIADNEHKLHYINYNYYPKRLGGLLRSAYNRWMDQSDKAKEEQLYDELYPIIDIDTSNETMSIVAEYINDGKLNLVYPSPRDILKGNTHDEIISNLNIELFNKYELDSFVVGEIGY